MLVRERAHVEHFVCQHLQTERNGWAEKLTAALNEIENQRKLVIEADSRLNSIKSTLTKPAILQIRRASHGFEGAGFESSLAYVEQAVIQLVGTLGQLMEERERCLQQLGLPHNAVKPGILDKVMLTVLNTTKKTIEADLVKFSDYFNRLEQRYMEQDNRLLQIASQVNGLQEKIEFVLSKKADWEFWVAPVAQNLIIPPSTEESNHDQPKHPLSKKTKAKLIRYESLIGALRTKIENLEDTLQKAMYNNTNYRLQLKSMDKPVATLNPSKSLRFLTNLSSSSQSLGPNETIALHESQVDKKGQPLYEGNERLPILLSSEFNPNNIKSPRRPHIKQNSQLQSLNMKSCLRCHKLYNEKDNHKKACRCHPKGKERMEKYDSQGKLVAVNWVWQCCQQLEPTRGCSFGLHL
ncbi:unnamed protein product [Owenia fusiformis]|uniref:Uncharacterized protein n=1 Tax=Owenia fusiformis TaxID=6347 RepID=A0A8S4N1V6_OWEFU|nr:unnamed protein product [Owenia fusiformis]